MEWNSEAIILGARKHGEGHAPKDGEGLAELLKGEGKPAPTIRRSRGVGGAELLPFAHEVLGGVKGRGQVRGEVVP